MITSFAYELQRRRAGREVGRSGCAGWPVLVPGTVVALPTSLTWTAGMPTVH